jgi:hypothetical protein
LRSHRGVQRKRIRVEPPSDRPLIGRQDPILAGVWSMVKP